MRSVKKVLTPTSSGIIGRYKKVFHVRKAKFIEG